VAEQTGQPGPEGEEASEGVAVFLGEELDALLLGVGQRIAVRRRRHNLTQEQLAQRAGCSPNTVIAVESGKRNVTVRNLALLSSALSVPFAELFVENSEHGNRASSGALAKLSVKLQAAKSIIETMQSMIAECESPSSQPKSSRQPS
jgi:transcriptional regulator with XRE-family HTH domain